ncbi:MAG TPA: maleylpyruvate isomerase N-terminal domain-containing protein, partial [Nakamurella sp.]|nr:maleylpyruvate isomerase N-terminal domain-containing protein [Nakamurella sp.]
LAASTDELLHELSTRDPSERCWTWYAENQSVGFWARRMAQETVIHRWDAERTIGEPAPIDARVAADGSDEFLVAFLSGDWSDDPQPAPYGSIAVFGSVDRWLVDLSADTVTVQRHAGTAVLEADSNAQISGTDEELLLALWGRRPLPAARGRSIAGGRAAQPVGPGQSITVAVSSSGLFRPPPVSSSGPSSPGAVCSGP